MIALTDEAHENPVRLDFTLREFHGYLFVRYGTIDGMKAKELAAERAVTEEEKEAAAVMDTRDKFRIKIVKAESLNSDDPFTLADPLCEVYFKDRCEIEFSPRHNIGFILFIC